MSPLVWRGSVTAGRSAAWVVVANARRRKTPARQARRDRIISKCGPVDSRPPVCWLGTGEGGTAGPMNSASVAAGVSPAPPENPNGIPSQSPGLDRAAGLPRGARFHEFTTPTGLRRAGATPLGLVEMPDLTRGSSFLATPGFGSQSLWDWNHPMPHPWFMARGHGAFANAASFEPPRVLASLSGGFSAALQDAKRSPCRRDIPTTDEPRHASFARVAVAR